MLEQIIGLVVESEGLGLALVFLILLACGFGLPVPEDITTIASGILVSEGTTKFQNAFLVCLAGILVGDSTIYLAGRLLGSNIFKSKFFSRFVNPKFLTTGETAFKKFGNKILFFARFLPGLRVPIYFFAGSIKTPFLFFIGVDTLAASISVPIWIHVGQLFGANIPVLEKAVKKLQSGTLLLVVLFILLLIGAHFVKKKIAQLIK